MVNMLKYIKKTKVEIINKIKKDFTTEMSVFLSSNFNYGLFHVWEVKIEMFVPIFLDEDIYG